MNYLKIVTNHVLIIPGKAIRKLEKMALNFKEGIDFEYDSFYVQTY